ncbi:uncharacterized protein [Prorops nasuta]|uniref:uncharacterized protein isoform X1 n=1 Tax=Prorops nasuta TaxID=863751 RepID=UPI0034D017F7
MLIRIIKIRGLKLFRFMPALLSSCLVVTRSGFDSGEQISCIIQDSPLCTLGQWMQSFGKSLFQSFAAQLPIMHTACQAYSIHYLLVSYQSDTLNNPQRKDPALRGSELWIHHLRLTRRSTCSNLPKLLFHGGSIFHIIERSFYFRRCRCFLWSGK